MTKRVQGSMYCPCGREKILANGLCASCYTLKRQDEEYFGGLRERVLERDGYRCRVCDASGPRQALHHCASPGAGESVLHLMISLCPACHAKIHRTRVAIRLMPPLLLELWRELHPKAHEQTALNFAPARPPAKSALLFAANAVLKQAK